MEREKRKKKGVLLLHWCDPFHPSRFAVSGISVFLYSCLEGEQQRQLKSGWHVMLGASLGEVAGAPFVAGPGEVSQVSIGNTLQV